MFRNADFTSVREHKRGGGVVKTLHRCWLFLMKAVEFSQARNIGNGDNIDIRGLTTWKKRWNLLPPVRIKPEPLIPSPTLSFLSKSDMCYLGGL